MYSGKAESAFQRAKKLWAKKQNEILTSGTLENIQYESFIWFAFHSGN